jgi:hypothetical protein
MGLDWKGEEKMRKAVTFARRTGQWELLSSNVTPLLGERPYLQEIAAELDSLIAEAKSLDVEQEEARSRLQDVIHRRQSVEKRGESLRRRVAAHLRGIFGFTNEELLKFGVQPRKTGPRGPRQKQPPVVTPPPPPATK